MAGKLNTYVFVHRHGESKGFGPDDTVPAWAAKLITNPAVWATPPAKTTEEQQVNADGAGDDSGAESGIGGAAGTEGTADGAEGSGEADEVAVPPKGGKGSSASAWAAYALSKGFEVDADAKASEIIDALAEAGIPTE